MTKGPLRYKKWTIALAALGLIRQHPFLTAEEHDWIAAGRPEKKKTDAQIMREHTILTRHYT